jgi:hypothetical protein
MGDIVKREPLTDRQKQLICEVRLCRPYGLKPTPGALPDCEELVTRGTLVRKMHKGEAHYFESDTSKLAAEMAAAIDARNRYRQSLNN